MTISKTTAGLAGLASAILFWSSLALFATRDRSYSHYTKAVSELGAVGAPQALAWNLLGYIVPGLLLAVFGAGLAAAIDSRRRLVSWLLIVSGLAFAGTGLIPAEMLNGSPDVGSPLTIGHTIMSFVTALAWLVATLLLIRPMRAHPAWRSWYLLSSALAGSAIVWGIFGESIVFWPGLNQRIRIGMFFAWVLIMALRLLSVERRTANAVWRI